MTTNPTVALLERTKALLTGHFLLSSGLHSDRYVQCALALRDPKDAEQLGQGLAAKLKPLNVTLVAGPAMGGVIIAHEVARALGVPMIFTERQEGKMALRRGFTVTAQDRIAIVEDVVTTGGSPAEVGDLLESMGAKVVAYGCIVDRTGGATKTRLPLTSLEQLGLGAWKPEDCPLCKAGGPPAIKPGSRPKPA